MKKILSIGKLVRIIKYLDKDLLLKSNADSQLKSLSQFKALYIEAFSKTVKKEQSEDQPKLEIDQLTIEKETSQNTWNGSVKVVKESDDDFRKLLDIAPYKFSEKKNKEPNFFGLQTVQKQEFKAPIKRNKAIEVEKENHRQSWSQPRSSLIGKEILSEIDKAEDLQKRNSEDPYHPSLFDYC